MEKFSNLDLGSTILSFCVAAGFVACGLVIIRFLLSGIKYLISSLRLSSNGNEKHDITRRKTKGF